MDLEYQGNINAHHVEWIFLVWMARGKREDDGYLPREEERRRLRVKRMKRFEVLDHTADVGIIVYGEQLNSLFENAGEALFHLITDLKKVRPRAERKIAIGGKSLERLMVEWLTELLYLHDVENLLFKRFVVESVGGEGLKAKVKGEIFKEGVHVIKTGVKAVTYHHIEVRQEEKGWKAQIILDL